MQTGEGRCWYKGEIQGHLILSNRDVGGIPIKGVIGERTVKISHDA
jgi:hypothetical protein